MDAGTGIAIATGIIGLAGLIFTALRYNRDDSTAAVNQQSTILSDMKLLNEELRKTAQDLKTERDELKGQVTALTEQVEAMRSELRQAHEQLARQVQRLQQSVDDGQD